MRRERRQNAGRAKLQGFQMASPGTRHGLRLWPISAEAARKERLLFCKKKAEDFCFPVLQSPEK
jgi:hypothetical protein